MKHKRAFIIAVCVATLLMVFPLVYRKVIVVMYGQQIPKAWSSNFADMNFGEIYQKIGLPQEDVSAKGYQNWLSYKWWGWQMLKMDLQDCCPLTSEPTGIYYIVHVNFWYDPAYTKTIRYKEVKAENRPQRDKMR